MKLEKRLNIRMTEDEFNDICKYAEAQKVSVSEAVRRAIRVFFYQKNLKKTGQNHGTLF